REQREPSDPLAGRAQLDLDALLGVVAVALRLGQPQATFAAGEERARDLREVAFDGRERLREAPLDRFRQLAAELVQLGERALEVGALRPQLIAVLLLARVLLLRERVDAAERLAAALQ